MSDSSNGEGFEALEKRCQRLLRERDALALLHGQVVGLRSPQDIDDVLEAVGESLRTAGIAFQDYSLNTIDRSTDPPIMRLRTRTPEGHWEAWQGNEVLLDMWRRSEVVYRRDLDTDDPHGESAVLKSSHHLRSVIDIPFSHGTLALNSPIPNAFTEEDIEFLKSVATVLSFTYRHWDSLRELERSRALDQISARLAEVRRQVVVAVYDMSSGSDIEGVLRVIQKGLPRLAIPYAHCSVNLIANLIAPGSSADGWAIPEASARRGPALRRPE